MKSPAAFDLKRYLDRTCARVDAALHELLPAESAPPPTIHKAMRYSIFAGGKRIRPILCLAACEAVGGNPVDGHAPGLRRRMYPHLLADP